MTWGLDRDPSTSWAKPRQNNQSSAKWVLAFSCRAEYKRCKFMWKYGRRLYLVILLAAVGMIQAQVPPPAPPASAASQLAEKKPDYSKEAFLGEQDQTRIVFENDGTGTRETTARVRIQSDAAIQRYGALTFPYESGTQSLEIDYVRVRKPDGTVIASPPENIQDMPAEITRQAPFYSDLREKHVAVKGLGSVRN